MKDSIESIWKNDFKKKENLIVPKVDNLLNQKSSHLIVKLREKFRTDVIITVIGAIAIPVVYYIIDAIGLGLLISALLLFNAYYGIKQAKSLKEIQHGSSSYNYLKDFNDWLNKALEKNEKMFRYSYTLYFIIAMTTIIKGWSKQKDLIIFIKEKYPNLMFVGDLPVFIIIVALLGTLAMYIFSKQIYKWDVRLIYGEIFVKIKDAITEIEEVNNLNEL